MKQSARKSEAAPETVIVGGGLAGMVAALELLDRSLPVLVVDRDEPEALGGLARESFGGIFLIGTPHQRWTGIRDTPERALRDWLSYAEFDSDDHWARAWAEQFVQLNHRRVYRWLIHRGVRFFPVVHWVERGLNGEGNSVPRFHVTWGTGERLTDLIWARLKGHPRARRCRLRFGHRVTELIMDRHRVTGVRGILESDGTPFEIAADRVVLAAGGIGGALDRVRRHWPPGPGDAPRILLNGAHRFADGTLHDAVLRIGGNVTHLDRMWHYAGGIHHPNPRRPDHGLSLVPPRSALWLNAHGERIGPIPLVSGFDTRYLVERTTAQPLDWTWQVLNRRIAVRELAVSGAAYNDAIRNRDLPGFLRTVLRGNAPLVDELTAHGKDVAVADRLEDLVDRMNTLAGGPHVSLESVRSAIARYDASIAGGPRFHNDDQLRRIAQLRAYRGDRVRTCKFQRILDPAAGPLMAIREYILTRKTLGGIQTDLRCRVLRPSRDGRQETIDGLYAIGEAAGFGGGGIHGKRALEGTFLACCVLTGQLVAAEIGGDG
jgi:predicted oxidoreductase